MYFLLDSYIKAADPSESAKVIEISGHAGKQDDLVHFLRTARKSLRETKIDMELAYIYAKTDNLVRFLRTARKSLCEPKIDTELRSLHSMHTPRLIVYITWRIS
jgi:hypothetical protein